jgi:phosphoenolpyruvate synthase/pyruvate phosphate dikinase
MKHNIPAPDLVTQYANASKEQRRELAYLAFEAEFDINRPFEIEWAKDDKYFVYEDYAYYYKPAHPSGLAEFENAEFIVETPHLCQYKV